MTICFLNKFCYGDTMACKKAKNPAANNKHNFDCTIKTQLKYIYIYIYICVYICLYVQN